MDGILRSEKGTFKEGTAPGPGRPKGQSLKEYWKERFQAMTPEEKAEFSKSVGLDTIWRMAEGNPHQTNDVKVELPPIPILGNEDKGTNTGL